MTQQELARKAGIPQPNLSNIEKGKQDLTISTLRKIALALSIHPREFFTASENQTHPVKLSRQKIEKIAKVITNQALPSGGLEKEIAELFRNILPRQGRIQVRKLNQAWLHLRNRLDSQEINAVCERVREHQRRQ